MARTGRPKLEDSRSHKISVRFSDEQVLMKGFEELERQAEADQGK